MTTFRFLAPRDRQRLERLAAREGTTPANLSRVAVRELLRAAAECDGPRPRTARRRRAAATPAATTLSVEPETDAAGGLVRYRAGKRLWSANEDQCLRREYPDTPTHELARSLRRSLSSVYERARSLGLSKSADYLASPHACRPHGDNVGASYRFQRGHVPANKGLRRPGWHRGRMRETQFKPGMRSGKAADHYKPVGSTRLIEGYVYRKVSDAPNVPYTVNWKAEHMLIWTAARGPIPPGHALVFKNGDRADVRLDNLDCISRRELMRRNSVHNLPKSLVATIQLLGRLQCQIRRKDHGTAQQD